MRILHAQPAKKPSRRVDLVKDKEQIVSITRELTELLFAENNLKRDKGRAGLALHHAQVTPDPFAVFVVLPGLIPSEEVNHWDTVFINAEIIDKKDKQLMNEGCMSFPHRFDKKMERFNCVIVKYTTLKNDKFVERNRTLLGVQAQIMQHECGHQAGQNIYQKK